MRIENYLSLKRRGLTNRKIFISYPLKRGGFKPKYFGQIFQLHDLTLQPKRCRDVPWKVPTVVYLNESGCIDKKRYYALGV
ncbi:hypothetical protein AFK68_10090 [Hydrocoleum sp. CS-953]|nr:hypothetical protein AFK68_10090 [Hydrocoleum sp. CS-953]